MSNEWIEWKGGKCPVSPETIVDVRLRDGGEEFGAKALAWSRGSDWWNHEGQDCFHIVAYRIHQEDDIGDLSDEEKELVRKHRADHSPITLEGWVNIYPEPGRTKVYSSKGEADILASSDRIACVPIKFTYKKGEGL